MENNNKKVVVIGAGGHAHSVCDILLQMQGIEIVGLVDNNAAHGFYNLDIIGNDESLPDIFSCGKADCVFVAVGSNKIREKLTLRALNIGYSIINAISPRAVISPNAEIGYGVAVMAGATVNGGASVGNGTILNTNCSVDHDTKIGEFVHIAPNCALCGNVTVGARSFLGVGTSVIDRINIGSNTVIGAGAAVVSDIPPDCTAVGVPAKVIKYSNQM